MGRRSLFYKSLIAFGLLAFAVALDGLVPSPAWAPPPPPPPHRRRPLPPPLRPKATAPAVVAPAPVAPAYRLENLTGHALSVQLLGGRILHIPPSGVAPIARANLSAPDVKAHLKRGEVAIIRVKP